MLRISEPNTENLRNLRLSPEVFHDALEGVLLGEYRFHVKNPEGEDFDLCYKENNSFFTDANATGLRFSAAVLPPYFSYNEEAVSSLCLDIFDAFSCVIFEEANEYTVVLTRLLQKLTTKRILFRDDRIRFFFSEEEVDVSKEETPENAFLCLKDGYENCAATGNVSRMTSAVVFHNVFLYQWLTELPLNQVRYALVGVLKSEGLGAILDHFTRMKNAFQERGIKAFLNPDSTRYPMEMLRNYFTFESLPEDSDETNTIYLTNFLPLRGSYLFYRSSGEIRREFLNAEFLRSIDEYYQGVFSDQKVLGVLIRGTDYVSLRMDGIRRQATPEEMIPVIDEWMEEDGYERIFLATEDQDILDKMRSVYGDKLVAVSQERFRVSDFRENEAISDLERRTHSGDKNAQQEDSTSNYFYALVILSKCQSFLCSGQVNGWDVVNSLNEGAFLRAHKMSFPEGT